MSLDATLPLGIRLHVEHINDFPGARNELRLICDLCSWGWKWGPEEPSGREVSRTAAEHHELHSTGTRYRHIPSGFVLGAVSHSGIRLCCAVCEWEEVSPTLDLLTAVENAHQHRLEC